MTVGGPVRAAERRHTRENAGIITLSPPKAFEPWASSGERVVVVESAGPQGAWVAVGRGVPGDTRVAEGPDAGRTVHAMITKALPAK